MQPVRNQHEKHTEIRFIVKSSDRAELFQINIKTALKPNTDTESLDSFLLKELITITYSNPFRMLSVFDLMS